MSITTSAERLYIKQKNNLKQKCMSKNLLIKVASVALAIFLSVTLLGFAFGGAFTASTNPSVEVYKKVEALSEKYKQNLLILVEHEPAVVQAKSSNAKIGEEIKGLMDFQPDQNQK